MDPHKEKNHIRHQQQPVKANVHILGFVLALLAGWVDTLAVALYMDENAAFMTGRVAGLAKALMDGQTGLAIQLLFILLAFFAGAVVSTWITRSRGLQGGLLLTGLLLLLTPFFAGFSHVNGALITLPMAMGAQNAASSLSAINRTTHLTGPTTDIAIQLAMGNWKKAAFWSLRWLAFFLGVVLSYRLIVIGGPGSIKNWPLVLAGGLILLLAWLQKQYLRIPLVCQPVKSR